MVDINCDLGEGIGNDAEIMAYIQSCNIACGGHFGDKETIQAAIKLAQKQGVKVGAHPSFPDRENFGRVQMNIDPNDLHNSLIEQIQLFQEVAMEEGEEMSHIKLHGALYNLAATDSNMAELIVAVFKEIKGSFEVYTPFNSILSALGNKYFRITAEAFIDRTYQSDLSLTPRTFENAFIKNPSEAWEQLRGISLNNNVHTAQGDPVYIEAQTFCIHGDSPTALETLRFIHKKLNND